MLGPVDSSVDGQFPVSIWWLTKSPLMYHVRLVAGEERSDVQLRSTTSPTEYRGFPPVMMGPRCGNSGNNNSFKFLKSFISLYNKSVSWKYPAAGPFRRNNPALSFSSSWYKSNFPTSSFKGRFIGYASAGGRKESAGQSGWLDHRLEWQS